jgi:PAS domain S-box-containing protein
MANPSANWRGPRRGTAGCSKRHRTPWWSSTRLAASCWYVQAETQFGYPRDELLGREVTDIIPTGFAERIITDGSRSAAEAPAQDMGTGIELVARRKDGGEFPIEIMLSPLRSSEGLLVTAAIRDISTRKAHEQLMKRAEERYRGLLEAAPHAMVVVSQSGEIVLLNVQAEKQFGYSRDELLGRRVTDIIPIGFAERLADEPGAGLHHPQPGRPFRRARQRRDRGARGGRGE